MVSEGESGDKDPGQKLGQVSDDDEYPFVVPVNDRDYKSHYHRYYTEPGKGRIGKGAEDRPCPVVIVLEIVEDWSYVEDPLIPYRRIRMLRNESRVVIEHVFLIVCDNIKVFPVEELGISRENNDKVTHTNIVTF